MIFPVLCQKHIGIAPNKVFLLLLFFLQRIDIFLSSPQKYILVLIRSALSKLQNHPCLSLIQNCWRPEGRSTSSMLPVNFRDWQKTA